MIGRQLPLDYQRGTACHEAGHAVLLHSLGVPVTCVHIELNDEQGWRGGTDVLPGADWHLGYGDRLVVLAAGRGAENFFKCHSYDRAWQDDLGKMINLLIEANVPEHEHWSRITEADSCARTVLGAKRIEVFRVVDLLVEYGKVDGSQFLHLMGK